jgi:predicted ABC-type ATPase
MTPDENIDLVSDKIDLEVARFIEGVDKSQNGIFNRLLGVVKGIETNDQGDIKQTVKNLKLLANVRKTIENEILTDAYKKRVASLENQFPAISSLNNGYFKFIDASFDPNRELYKEVIKTSISATRASLLESGVSENVINPIVNIVNDSVTSGSTFADMVDELRVIIKGDEERLGQLMRYSKQITQDALNQFNAGYNETIAKDLDLEWYFYSGGRRRTSRPFCKKYAGRYFHKKEVEDFGKRIDLDASNLCGGKKDLCQGRVKGTNSSNIFRYRGGYNCKHIYKPTLIDSVPNNVINRNIEKGYYLDRDDIETIADNNKDTEELYTKDGVYTKQRQKLHDRIQTNKLRGHTPVGKEKTVYMTGGPSANGKSTLINSGKVKHPKNMVTIDSDAIKGDLPEYNALLKIKDPRAAAFAHEESSFVSKKILKTSVDGNYNALLDGTGDGSIESLTKKIKGMKANGHRVSAEYVTLDTDLSLKLAKIRGKKTGRFIPDEFIKNANQKGSTVLVKALENDLFDDMRLWDTNVNGVPRLILEHKNHKTKIFDKKLYDRFLAKGNPDTDFSKFKHLDD